jgi:hypothetical protein
MSSCDPAKPVSYTLPFTETSGMKLRSLIAAAMILLGALHSYAQPLIDYHQHLLSPAAAGLGSLPGRSPHAI